MAVGVRYSTFPRTDAPPEFVPQLVAVFESNAVKIDTTRLAKGLTSNEVLDVLRPGLLALGFHVEAGKSDGQKIRRPVFYGENGIPTLQYEVDAFHPGWQCGLEIEAGRAWMGNAVYRDLIQALVMVQIRHLVLAVPIGYRYSSKGKSVVSNDYERTVGVADALYGHSRLHMPYGLTVVGY